MKIIIIQTKKGYVTYLGKWTFRVHPKMMFDSSREKADRENVSKFIEFLEAYDFQKIQNIVYTYEG